MMERDKTKSGSGDYKHTPFADYMLGYTVKHLWEDGNWI